ncbi:MAG: prephenate dehydrogenase/arogenate dehydrogenase family protein [Limisphaerales bacterium]
MQFQKISIIGVGLLGGSIGLAARQRKLAGEIAGFVRRPASLNDCEKTGAVDYATTDLLAAVSNSDLVILCTPLAQMRPLAEQFLPALKRGAIVTDVGSVKAGVVRELESLVAKAGAHFIGGHPMAGGEKMGVRAARADLFVNAVNILTPTKKSNTNSVRKLEQFWKSLGARTLQLAPAKHDWLVSRSSHLPHVVAMTLAGLVLDPKQPESAGRALRGWLSRHDPHRVQFAGDVARHHAGQSQKHCQRGGRVHCRPEEIPIRTQERRRRGG